MKIPVLETFACVGFLLLLVVSDGWCSSYCYNCSSVSDNYCPEFMTSDDESIVPYISCKNIHSGRFCVKTTGVNGGSTAIRCFRCDDSFASGCSESVNTFYASLSDCKDVFEATFCVKTLQVFNDDKRSLGTTRFCSSRDLGNYCEYIRRPGDKLEYRSCVFTCSSDGCNESMTQKSSSSVTLLIAIATVLLFFCFC